MYVFQTAILMSESIAGNNHLWVFSVNDFPDNSLL